MFGAGCRRPAAMMVRLAQVELAKQFPEAMVHVTEFILESRPFRAEYGRELSVRGLGDRTSGHLTTFGAGTSTHRPRGTDACIVDSGVCLRLG